MKRGLYLLGIPALLICGGLAAAYAFSSDSPQPAAALSMDNSGGSSTSGWTGITVTGHGEADGTPDTGYINVGVQVTAKSVADARSGAATSANAVIAAVKADGVDAKDIQTTDLSINPQYSNPKDGETPTITGYMVTNTVAVKVRNLDNFSKVIDDATAAGGDNARVQGISFGIDDPSKLQAQAREAAMNDAKAKAQQLASLSGAKLGPVQAISETQVNAPMKMAAAGAPYPGPAMDVSTPIQPGTSTVSVDVSVRWTLQ